MELIVLGWLMLDLTNSPFMVALVGFYRLAPVPILGPFLGVLTDRIDRKIILAVQRGANLINSSLLLTLILTDLVQPWNIALLLVVSGICFAIDATAMPAYAYDVLGAKRIANGMSLDSMIRNLGHIIGPILAGVMISLGDNTAGLAYLALVSCNALAFLLALLLPRLERKGRGPQRSWITSLREGLGYALSIPMVKGVLALTVIMNVLAFPFHQLIPVFARDVLHVGPTLLGVLAASPGIGAMVGSAVVASAPPQKRAGPVFAASCLAQLALLIIFSFSPWFVVSSLVLFIYGLANAIFSPLQSTLILVFTSDEMRGRAMGILTLAIGAGPPGAMGIGITAGALGAPAAVAIASGLGLALVGSSVLRFPALRKPAPPQTS